MLIGSDFLARMWEQGLWGWNGLGKGLYRLHFQILSRDFSFMMTPVLLSALRGPGDQAAVRPRLLFHGGRLCPSPRASACPTYPLPILQTFSHLLCRAAPQE